MGPNAFWAAKPCDQSSSSACSGTSIAVPSIRRIPSSSLRQPEAVSQVAFEGNRIDDPDIGHTESQDFADFLSHALGLVVGRQNLDPEKGWSGEYGFCRPNARHDAEIRNKIPASSNSHGQAHVSLDSPLPTLAEEVRPGL